MDKRYARLKRKMLLLVVAGTLAALAVGMLLLHTVVDGVLQDPFARAFLWVAQNLFGQDEAAALELYQQTVRNQKPGLLALGIFGILPPTTTALLHNASTMAISAASMRPYLPAPGGRGAQGKEPGNETA